MIYLGCSHERLHARFTPRQFSFRPRQFTLAPALLSVCLLATEHWTIFEGRTTRQVADQLHLRAAREPFRLAPNGFWLLGSGALSVGRFCLFRAACKPGDDLDKMEN